jgi:hypothetical protein
MTSWTNNELGRIGAADELQLLSFKGNDSYSMADESQKK